MLRFELLSFLFDLLLILIFEIFPNLVFFLNIFLVAVDLSFYALELI
jgi:hypothetical protein